MSAPPARAPGAGLLQAALLAVVLVLVAEDAGQPLARWGVAGVVVVALAGIAVTGLPRPSRPAPVLLAALGGLAAFTLWAYLSILWAEVPGDAWQGANRTLLYLLVFAVAALWAPAGPAAARLVAAFSLGTGVLAAVVLARLAAGPPDGAFFDARLALPAGYPNAAVSLWLIGAAPALVLASRRRTAWWLRGPLAAAAVLQLGLALTGQSRGALFTLAAVAAVALLALPRRVRLGAVLVAAIGAVATAAPALLRVGERADEADGATTAALAAALDEAVRSSTLAALGLGVLVGLWALVEARRPPSPAVARTLHRGLAAAGLAAAAAGAVLVMAAGPVDRARDAWRSFQGDYAQDFERGDRLTGGLGSGRHDFWRVAIDAFEDDPLRGAGMDQFRRRYLREGRSTEEPRYPHSMPLAVLSQTGVVGALLLLLGLGGALAAALERMRARRGTAGTAAAAAALGTVAWLAHASIDWVWETAGLGAAALLLLGWAAGVRDAPAPPAPPLARRRVELAAAAAWVVALTAALALPWLADRDLARGGAAFAAEPGRALGHFDRAARLDPLSAAPATAEGTARVRLGDLAGADAAFAEALRRAPGDPYATLMRGVIASAQGRRDAALALVRAAIRASPRDDVAREALAGARDGRLDPLLVQRALLDRVR